MDKNDSVIGWGLSRRLTDLEGVAAGGCQLTALLTVDQKLLLKGGSKGCASMGNGYDSPLLEPCRSTLLHIHLRNSFTRVCYRVTTSKLVPYQAISLLLQAGCFLDGIVYNMTSGSHGHGSITVLPLL